MLSQSLAQVPCTPDVQMTGTFAKQVDALRRGVFRHRGYRGWLHSRQTFERPVHRLDIFFESLVQSNRPSDVIGTILSMAELTQWLVFST